LWTKVHDILRPLYFPGHLPDYVYRACFFRRYRPLKLPLSCEVVENRSVLNLRFVGGGIPDFGHTFSNRTHFRTCGRFWLFCSASSEIRGRKNEEERKKESVVKYKSADMYVGRPKNIEEDRRIAVKPKSADDYVGRPNNWQNTQCVCYSFIGNCGS